MDIIEIFKRYDCSLFRWVSSLAPAASHDASDAAPVC